MLKVISEVLMPMRMKGAKVLKRRESQVQADTLEPFLPRVNFPNLFIGQEAEKLGFAQIGDRHLGTRHTQSFGQNHGTGGTKSRDLCGGHFLPIKEPAQGKRLKSTERKFRKVNWH